MEKKKNTPKLRFPEFTGEWEEKKLGEIAEKVNSGKTPLGGESVYVDKGILFIRSQNVFDNKLSLENATFITEETNSTMENSIVKSKDILLNITGASLGRSCVVPENFIVGNVNQHVCIIRLNKDNEPYFFQPIFASEKGQNLFKSLQVGGGREGLNFQSIRGITLYQPPLSEQTKIATFLTAVDEKLTQLKKKKTLLEQYKKGVMQKLFSQELRFKDDNNQDFPDWQEKTLGEISKITNGNGDVQDASLEAKDGWYPFYDRSEIVKYLDRYTFDGEAIIYPGEGQSFFPRYFNGKYGLHQRCYTIKDYCANIHGKYLYYYLSTQNNYFIAFAVGSTVPSLRLDTFQQAKVLLPSLVEQQKIATFLSAIDEKISHSSAQIEKMEAWKKGLLQQMFC